MDEPQRQPGRAEGGLAGYRRALLGLAFLTNALVVAAPSMCMPVLFEEISAELGLSLVQVGAVWGISALPGIFTSLPGGAIGDRFGPRRILIASCAAIGLLGALRGLANGFWSLAGAMLALGLVTPFITTNTLKACGLWFPPRQLGLASGALSMGMAGGFLAGSLLSATLLSPLLGGWRQVLFFYGAIGLALSVPWIFTRPRDHASVLAGMIPGAVPSSVLAGGIGRENAGAIISRPPAGVDHSSVPAGMDRRPRSMRQALGHVSRLRNVWLFGLAILGIGGCIQGALGYLPLYLRGQGWPEAQADGALAAFHTISLVFTIPIAFGSDRLGSRRKVLAGAALAIASGVGLLAAAEGALVWIAVGLAGMVRDGFMAVFMTSIIETEGVGVAYAGTAIGVVMIFAGLGSLLAPPLGNSLAALGLGAPFVFWSALALLGLAGILAARERKGE